MNRVIPAYYKFDCVRKIFEQMVSGKFQVKKSDNKVGPSYEEQHGIIYEISYEKQKWFVTVYDNEMLHRDNLDILWRLKIEEKLFSKIKKQIQKEC